MNYWILVILILFLIGYSLLSMAFVPLIDFKYHDKYLDKDLDYGPKKPSWLPEKGFFIDLHTHTTYSDGILTPKQLVLWHISNGYDGMVVTDHNTMEAVEKCKKHAQDLDPDFLVIPGVEFTSLKTHLNIIGNKTLMRVPSKIWTRKKVIKEAIDHAHKEGAVVQFNHKDWYFHKKYMSKEWYLEHKIDGFEIYNGFGFVDEEGLDFIKEHKSERTMFASAGTDVHDPAKHYRMYTNVLTQDRTVDGVIKALKEGKTEVYSNIKQEKKEERPEKGKLIKNPRKQKIIKRWKWLNWLGYDLFWYGKIKKIIAFYASYSIITIALAILL